MAESDSDSWDAPLRKRKRAPQLDHRSHDDSDADSWDDPFQNELCLSKQEAEAVTDACAALPDGDSDEDDESSSSTGFKLTAWWSQWLMNAATSLGWEWPGRVSKPLRVISACTGCSAESAVLKAKPGFFFRIYQKIDRFR